MAPEPAYIGWSASDDYPMRLFGVFFCRGVFTTYYNKFSSNGTEVLECGEKWRHGLWYHMHRK